MKIGLIAAAYNCGEYLDDVLKPWSERKDKHDIYISIIHVCFKENQELGLPTRSADNTEKILEKALEENIIDYYESTEEPLTEPEARTRCLDDVKKHDIDYLWSLGLDEIYTVEEIEKIIKFVEFNKFISWFNINFKNYLFENDTWIDGFAPPRIFNARCNEGIKQLYYDDDVIYNDGSDYKILSNLEIPRSMAHIKHMTWLNNETSRRKCEYQKSRWGEDFCSYLWDYDEEKLKFNENYYKIHNKQKPKLNYD